MQPINAVPLEHRLSPATARGYSAPDLLALPHFRDGLAHAAGELIEKHRALPKRVRYVADLQKWMLSHGAMALHFEHKLDPARPPITPTNLVRFFGDMPVASKNTILAFLMEMRHYNFVEPVDDDNRRTRIFRATRDTEELLFFYFHVHLRALDIMDGGNRLALFLSNPGLLPVAQPRLARLLMRCDGWLKPPATIAGFSKSDSGSSVLHDLAARVPEGELGHEPIWIGHVSATEVSRRYLVSQTHAVRLFARAKAQGLIGWEGRTNRGECWISPLLVRDYHYWQATKLAAFSQAMQAACESIALHSPEPPDAPA